MRIDADRDETQNVLADAHLTLHLGDRGRRRVDVEQGEMRLAVLLDPVGERLDAPVLGLADLPAVLRQELLVPLRHGLHLLGGDVLTDEIYVLVESHCVPFSSCHQCGGCRAGAEPFEPGERPDGFHRRRRHGKTGLLALSATRGRARTFRSAPGRSGGGVSTRFAARCKREIEAAGRGHERELTKLTISRRHGKRAGDETTRALYNRPRRDGAPPVRGERAA